MGSIKMGEVRSLGAPLSCYHGKLRNSIKIST
jgi:hypothetical protein